MQNEPNLPQFKNKVVKQGNSLCIRIPLSIVRELKLDTGDDVSLSIHKMDYEKYSRYYEEDLLFRINKVKEFDKYSNFLKKLFITLTFEIVKECKDPDPVKEDQKQKDILKQYSVELGDKLILEYIKFHELIRKYVIKFEKDGSMVTR